jgi:hypothetical protein
VSDTTRQHIDGFDVIGDVHGHLHALLGLLTQMGYAEIEGIWRHPTRQAIFVGDLVDRGTQQVALIQLVQKMVQAGSAQMVLGNHEYNAVAWHTPDPGAPGRFCRDHTEKNRSQHAEFLAQVGEGSTLHVEILQWLVSLPLWLELRLGRATLRVVHACWDQASMEVLQPRLAPAGGLTIEAVVATSIEGSQEYDALEILLKGPEIELGGLSYIDGDSFPRDMARRKWWDPTANTLRKAAIIPNGARTPENQPFPELADTPIPPVGPTDTTPVIVGHYWCTPPVQLWSSTVACVDYSVARKGPMVAYRWGGEGVLTVDNYEVHQAHQPSTEDEDGSGGT